MTLIFRKETPADYKFVEKIIEEAFANEAYSDQTEHLLVARLRNSDAFIPELSMVAEVNGEIVGHILLTKITIKNAEITSASLALAPVSVKPAFQKQGIGGMLIEEAHRIARPLGYRSIVLLGHAGYYPRFGYRKGSDFGISLPFEVPDENCMVLELVEGGLEGVRGEVVYSEEFG